MRSYSPKLRGRKRGPDALLLSGLPLHTAAEQGGPLRFLASSLRACHARSPRRTLHTSLWRRFGYGFHDVERVAVRVIVFSGLHTASGVTTLPEPVPNSIREPARFPVYTSCVSFPRTGWATPPAATVKSGALGPARTQDSVPAVSYTLPDRDLRNLYVRP
jgi:hypothetical protein